MSLRLHVCPQSGYVPVPPRGSQLGDFPRGRWGPHKGIPAAASVGFAKTQKPRTAQASFVDKLVNQLAVPVGGLVFNLTFQSKAVTRYKLYQIEAARNLCPRYTIHISKWVLNDREVALEVTTFYDRQDVYQE
jgi:hypothetical protein